MSRLPRLIEKLLNPYQSNRLEYLVSFFANPTRYLLRKRLGILIELEKEEPKSREPFGFERLSEQFFEPLLNALEGD